MSIHLQRDMEHLKKAILSLGSMVEEATNKSILALVDRRPDLSQEVINGDAHIDREEVEIEEDCLKILALHQPVAADLRFIIGVLKVNNDLERMGDLCLNIAERAAYLCSHEPLVPTVEFSSMAKHTLTMLRRSLDALIGRNTVLAREVLAMDDRIDEANRRMFARLQDLMRQDPELIDRCVQLISVSRYLERIADLTTNIAEDVVFMIDGELIRHQPPGGS
ncbi:MAG: phosphate signaling complex protein PhoU [Acidobacteriota bacterium]